MGSWYHIPCIWLNNDFNNMISYIMKSWHDCIHEIWIWWFQVTTFIWYDFICYICMYDIIHTWNHIWWFRDIIFHAHDFNNKISCIMKSWHDFKYLIWIWYHNFTWCDFICYICMYDIIHLKTKWLIILRNCLG